MRCPACDSDDVQSYPMAYETSRSASAIQTNAVSIGVTHSTPISSLTAPPTTRENSGCVIGCGVVAALAIWAVTGTIADVMVKPTKAMPYLPIYVGLLPPLIALILVWFMFRAAARQEAHFEEHELPALMEHWRRSWLCRRCGQTFLVE